MNVYVEYDAMSLAKLIGASSLPCDGVIMRHGRPDDILAVTLRGNLLNRAENWMLDAELPARRVVAWSGSLSPLGLFESHPENWLRSGREALASACRELLPQFAEHGWRLCFHPHARHVLSDPQSCLNLLREFDQASNVLEVALSPATMLEPSMLTDVEDHLRRMFQGLGAKCSLVMLADVTLVGKADLAHCKTVPLGEGVLPRSLILGLLSEFVSADVPIVLGGERVAEQMKWLAG